jgi:FKBP-type peptidyl-prolyl cis-trans isomerase
MTPVAPPGLELKRVTSFPEGDGAAALGERPDAIAGEQVEPPLSKDVSPPTNVGQKATTKTGLEYITLKAGTGREAKPGDIVTVHCTGTLDDGTRFETTRDFNEPIQFRLGTGLVIKGWDEGLSGMKVGELRRLAIPPHLGYGPAGKPPKIPANATLHYDVELLEVRDAK